MKEKIKRRSGMITEDDKWFVLTESAGNAGVGYTHECGAKIMGREVRFIERDGDFPCSGSGKTELITVPFCPECERKPQSGEILVHEGHLIIFS